MSKKRILPFCLVVAALVVGCQDQTNKKASNNPLLMDYETPFQVPPFDQIELGHYKPAFEEALKVHNEEMDSLGNQVEDPSFQNVIVS